jgi:hypothetical protein
LPKYNENDNNKENKNNYNNKNELLINNINQKYPDSKKIAKLIKILICNFPKYSIDFFICYLLSKIKFRNFNEKSNEIKNFIYLERTSKLQLHFMRPKDITMYKSKTSHILDNNYLSKMHYISMNKQINKINTVNNTKRKNKSYNNIINKNNKTKLNFSKNRLHKYNLKQNSIKTNIINRKIIKLKIENINRSKDKNNKKVYFINDMIPINNKTKNKDLYLRNKQKNNNCYIKITKKPKIKLLKDNNNNNTSNFSLNKIKAKNIVNKGIFVVKRNMTSSQDFDDSLYEENKLLKKGNDTNDNIKRKIYLTPPKKNKI